MKPIFRPLTKEKRIPLNLGFLQEIVEIETKRIKQEFNLAPEGVIKKAVIHDLLKAKEVALEDMKKS